MTCDFTFTMLTGKQEYDVLFFFCFVFLFVCFCINGHEYFLNIFFGFTGNYSSPMVDSLKKVN